MAYGSGGHGSNPWGAVLPDAYVTARTDIEALCALIDNELLFFEVTTDALVFEVDDELLIFEVP